MPRVKELHLNKEIWIYKNDYNKSKSNRGPAWKLKKYEELRIKTEITVKQKSIERVTASKLKISLILAVKKRTIQRQLKKMKYS